MIEAIVFIAVVYHGFALMEYFSLRNEGYTKDYCSDKIYRKYYGS